MILEHGTQSIRSQIAGTEYLRNQLKLSNSGFLRNSPIYNKTNYDTIAHQMQVLKLEIANVQQYNLLINSKGIGLQGMFKHKLAELNDLWDYAQTVNILPTSDIQEIAILMHTLTQIKNILRDLKFMWDWINTDENIDLYTFIELNQIKYKSCY